MLAIPNVPTDNLYKFLALTGLIIAILCFGTLEYRSSEQQRLDVEVGLGIEDIEYFKLDFKKYITKAIELNNQLHEDYNENKAELTDNAKEILSRIKNLDNNNHYLIKRSEGFNQEIMKLRKKSETAELHQQRTKRIKILLTSFGIFGLVLAGLGFYLWYVKLQKYQDALVKNEAMKHSGTA